MNKTTISVALPVYNGANYLREALDSILAQDFQDFELVVSDNCSTDKTPEILAEYAARDVRVRIFRSDTFLAQADNVNRAVELCSSDWVKLFCHDDLMKPECLNLLHKVIIDPHNGQVGLIGNGEERLYENGYRHNYQDQKKSNISQVNGKNFITDFLHGNTHINLPSLTTATVRKKAWISAGRFDCRFVHFDTFLWMRLLMQSDYIYIPNVLTTNRIHGAQVAVGARKSLRSVEDHRLFWQEFLDEFGYLLQISIFARVKVKLRPIAIAASTLAISLMQHGYLELFHIVRRLPKHWWPMLPILIIRSLRNERKRIARLKGKVPLALIYQG